MASLSGQKVAILATDGFEELELTEPLRALRMAGAQVEVIAPHEGSIQAEHLGHKTIRIHVDRLLADTVLAEQYDALVLPGGRENAAALRKHPEALRFVREMDLAEKPVAAICHAPWILISAGCVRDQRMTSYPEIAQDLIAAGAEWVDAEAVVHDNLITSRAPADMPAFNREIVEMFGRKLPLISPDTRHLFSRSRIA